MSSGETDARPRRCGRFWRSLEDDSSARISEDAYAGRPFASSLAWSIRFSSSLPASTCSRVSISLTNPLVGLSLEHYPAIAYLLQWRDSRRRQTHHHPSNPDCTLLP